MNNFRLISHSIFRRRKKSFILFTSIFVSVAIIVSFISSYQGMMEAIETGIDDYGKTFILSPSSGEGAISYHGIPIVIPSNELEQQTLSLSNYEQIIASQQGLIGASPRIIKEAHWEEVTQDLVMVGIDIDGERSMKPWWKVWGNWPSTENQIIIGFDIGDKFGLHAGDTMSLLMNGEEMEFRVSGRLHYTGYTDDRLIYVPYQHPHFLASGDVSFMEMVVSFQTTEQVAPPQGWQWREQQGPLREERLESVDRITQFAPYIIGVTVLLGSLIICITLMNEVGERRKEFALWQAIGLRKQKIITLLLMEITAMAVVSTFAGILLGLVLGNIWSSLMSGFQYFAWITMTQGLYLFFFILLVTVLVSFIPIVMALKQEPITLLRNE